MITILIVSHKDYWIPSLSLYKPIQVNKACKTTTSSHWSHDWQGENISFKNHTFCELTALYWAWKNLDADIIGLCHYRRYMGDHTFWKPKKQRLLQEREILSLLKTHDMILPRKRHYWIETREQQYAHAHHIEDLRATEQALTTLYPEYLPAWQHMLKTRSGHICNMFIMRREQLNAYCEWLFDILFEVEKHLDISNYSDKDKRVFGYLGERLLDVWIEKNGLSYVEVPMINLERQHWLRKIGTFLRRKFQQHPND